jgi:hypothetical protein
MPGNLERNTGSPPASNDVSVPVDFEPLDKARRDERAEAAGSVAAEGDAAGDLLREREPAFSRLVNRRPGVTELSREPGHFPAGWSAGAA